MSTAEATTQIKLGFESAGLKLATEEFDAVEDFDELYRYELVHGVVVVNPIPLEAEADPNEQLGHLLRSYRESHRQGSALDLTLAERYIVTRDSRRRADRVIWAGLGRRPNPKVDVPTIAVEFVSAGKRNWMRDYETKRDEYLEAGVVEYWIIDRFERIMTVYQKREKETSIQIVREDESYRTDLLPGFELPLSALLAEADKWEEEL